MIKFDHLTVKKFTWPKTLQQNKITNEKNITHSMKKGW